VSRPPASSGHSHEVYHAPHNPWLIAVVATLATFMEVLDTSIANVALPHIAGNLGASVNDSTWVLTSYLVANAIVLPASAWLASVLGRRNYYLVSVSIFAASSFLCGIAPSLGMLVAFRLLQGLGGGGLQPLTQSILVDTFPPRMRGMGMAVYGMTVVVAPVIGPTLGGWITDNYNWRWIFFINVPIGALALFLSSRYISDPPYFLRRTGERRWSGDFFGLSLLAMGLGSLQMMLDLGDRYDWFHSPFIVGCAVLAGLALLAGVLWSLNHREPIVNLRVLRDRNLSLSRVDARWMIVFGILIVAYALWMMSGLTLQTDFRTIVIARVVQGFGLAFIFVPINTVAYANVAGVDRNNASSLISIARNIGGSIGIGYTAAMLSQGTQIHRAMMVRDLTPASPVYNSTVGALQDHLETAIGDPTRAADMAQGIVGSTLDMQARMLTYLDQFKLLAVAFLLLVPIVILMRRRKQGGHVELVVE
jgi:DHA2 family multidrug resistance protein